MSSGRVITKYKIGDIIVKFHTQFLIGAATAAHQVEGNNINSDCWALENRHPSSYKEPSLSAVDHYNKYREDIKLLKEAGLNTYRFSIEWARIEPIHGRFENKEIEHYKDVLQCCIDNEITPIVTLHHFSSPKWLISEGGWESEKTIEYFGNYCNYVVTELGEFITYICTINEANMGLQLTRVINEMMMKMQKDRNNAHEATNLQVGINLDIDAAFNIPSENIHPFLTPRTKNGDLIIMKCHEKAREIIKAIHPEIQVGITLSLFDHQTQQGGEEFQREMQNEEFLHYLPFIEKDDFFGLQNYTRKVYNAEGTVGVDENARLTDIGYEFYPEALAGVIRFVAQHWKKPILITENGVSTNNDKERVEFIEKALSGLYQCINEGINVIGYIHWSLLDNFEWQLGYTQKFGLIAVDRLTQIRYPKESLKVLGAIKKYGYPYHLA